MTKLKQPIVVTIETVENAVQLAMFADNLLGIADERFNRINRINADGEIAGQICATLLAQGIDYRTWEPPQPLLIASHKVTANPDGSIKVGCTAVTRAELEAAYKLSTEAMGGEWPKYYASPFEKDGVYVAKSESEVFWNQGGKEVLQSGKNSWFAKEPSTFKPLTPHEAKAILEGKQ